ncbi:MAG: TIGR02588 family protein [Ilumatobacteraceae bacterium]
MSHSSNRPSNDAPNNPSNDPSKRPKRVARNRVEWITFAVAAAIVVAIATLMVVQSFGPSDPPAPVAELAGEPRDVDGRWFVPVDVRNLGDETAAEVQVTAELTFDGVTSTGDQVIDFLGGDEVVHLTFGFDHDPARGKLVLRVTGFSQP